MQKAAHSDKQYSGKSYQRFLDSLNRSTQTKEKYKREFSYYLDWLKLPVTDVDDLISSRSEVRIREIEDKIIDYIKHLYQIEKLSYSTIHVRLAAIFNFYTINRVHIDRRYISKFKPVNKKRHKGDLAYTAKQIGKLLETSNTDLRARTIILLLSSTGMRIGALHSLTIGSLTPIKLEGYDSHLYKIKVYESDREEYYTFCTFECAAAIDNYLDYRKRFGEILNPNAPLIRDEFNPWDAKSPRFLSDKSFHSIMDRVLILSGSRARTRKKERHLHDVMASHGFRKFTITQMIKAGLEYSTREFLVGHRGSRGLDVNYDRTSEEDRLQEYIKAMDLLTISPENRLRRQVQEQDHTIKVQLAQKDQQIQELMNWKDKMEILLNEPDKFIQMLQEGRRRK